MKKSTPKNRKFQIISLIVLAILVVVGGFLFVAASAGWFNQSQKFILDSEYQDSNVAESLTSEEYEQMVTNKKSFIVIAHLPTCTADIISYMKKYSAEHNISYFYLNWSDLRNTSLKDVVNFSPSVILISKGVPIAHLRADSDDDVEKYNNYDAFSAWLDGFFSVNE